MQVASLNRWVVQRLGWILIGFATLSFALSAAIVDRRFAAIERQVVAAELARASAQLQQALSGLRVHARDYAYWDDALAFVRGENAAFATDNFSAEVAGNLDLDWVVVIDAAGRTLLARTLADEQAASSLDPVRIAAARALFGVGGATGGARTHGGVHWSGTRAELLGCATIVDSDGGGPAAGGLCFARALDERRLATLRTLAAVPFQLQPVAAAESTSVADEPALARAQVAGLPLVVTVAASTSMAAERRATLILLAANAAAIALLSLFVIHALLRRKVLDRLQHFSELANRRRSNDSQRLQWPLHGSDELDNLAASLNELMSETHAHATQLQQLASQDELTELINRRGLIERVDAALAAHSGARDGAALLLVDLDGFKDINDSLGHATGDDVLVQLARRVRAELRPGDHGARLGGDEFAIYMDAASPQQAMALAERLRALMAQPLQVSDRTLVVSASLGLASTGSGDHAEDLLRRADLAMHEAKRLGKNRVVAFDESLHHRATRRHDLEQSLRRSLDLGQIQVWYQPIVDARDGHCIGMEALARWFPEGGSVPPTEFIPIAEQCGLITALSGQVFDQACATLARLRDRWSELTLSLNLSLQHCLDDDVAQHVLRLAERHRLPPSALRLEITESQVLQNADELVPMMTRMTALGVHFDLDDFGTGYSSLDRLHRLPIHALKLDRSFVAAMSHDEAMARCIINLCHDIELDCIAEGVETEAQRERLLAMGGRRMQGYLFARPMPEAELAGWLERHAFAV